MHVRRKRAPKPAPSSGVSSDITTPGRDLARRILEAVPAGVVQVSMQGAICFANAAAMDFLGLSYDELSTVYVSDFDRKVICDDGRPCAAGDYPVSRCLATGKPQLPTTLGVQRPDGNTRWGIFSAVPVHDDDERLFGAVVTFIDITERRQTEEALREGEERYRHLVELCPDGILVHTEGNVLFANKALAEILEMKNSSELIGVPVMDIVHPSFRRVVQRRIKELLNGAPAQPWMEQKLVRRNGSAVEIEAAARPFTFKGRHAVQVMLRDITDRKRRDEERDQLFNQVESARARLELLSRRLVDVQEAERRRIARELHDEIGQELTALKLDLDRCASIGRGETSGAMREAQTRVDHLVSLVRQMSLELRPTMLDDLGLVPTLHWHFDRYTAVSGVRVHFKHNGVTDRRFPVRIETAAYRMIQEALTNVVRHSKAKEVSVRVWASDSALSIQVEDGGTGFDPEAALAARISSGLSGMRERAALLGGHLTIESTPGAGAHLTAEFPLSHNSESTNEQNTDRFG